MKPCWPAAWLATRYSASVAWAVSHSRFMLAGGVASALICSFFSSSSKACGPWAAPMAMVWIAPYSTARIRPSGHGSNTWKPGPSTATGAPRRS